MARETVDPSFKKPLNLLFGHRVMIRHSSITYDIAWSKISQVMMYGVSGPGDKNYA